MGDDNIEKDMDVVCKGETYSLLEPPDKDSAVVVEIAHKLEIASQLRNFSQDFDQLGEFMRFNNF